jgi:hypothetical protein
MSKDTDKQTLTLTIGTPKGTFTADFQKTAKVSDVIAAAIEKKGLAGSPSEFEVFFDETPLTPVDRTLVSFHLKDGDTLLVAAQGQGV